MKKIIYALICLILVFCISACGCPHDTAIGEPSTEEPSGIIPNSVPAGSAADIGVREAVAKYIDTFISCDFDAIKSMLHENDKWLFNFESEDQLAFYKAIFPQIKYNFEFVSEYEGVYGVMTNISSPDMAEVYGSIITDYIDSSIGANDLELSDIVDNNTERLLELIESPELSRREERLYVYVEYINGEYIPRCDAFLANELTGGAPEASDEITSSINETLNALTE